MKALTVLFLVVLAAATCQKAPAEFKSESFVKEIIEKHLSSYLEETQKKTTLPSVGNFKLYKSSISSSRLVEGYEDKYLLNIHIDLQDENLMIYSGILEVTYTTDEKKSFFKSAKIVSWSTNLSSNKNLPGYINFYGLSTKPAFWARRNFAQEILNSSSIVQSTWDYAWKHSSGPKNFAVFYKDIKMTECKFVQFHYAFYGQARGEAPTGRPKGFIHCNFTATYQGKVGNFYARFFPQDLRDASKLYKEVEIHAVDYTQMCDLMFNQGFPKILKQLQENKQILNQTYEVTNRTCEIKKAQKDFKGDVVGNLRGLVLNVNFEDSKHASYKLKFIPVYNIVISGIDATRDFELLEAPKMPAEVTEVNTSKVDQFMTGLGQRFKGLFGK